MAKDEVEIKQYFVTFGLQYSRDPERGEQHPMGMHGSGYAVIDAPNYDTAHRMAAAIFGERWAFIYDEEGFKGQKEKYYFHPDSELLWIAWHQKGAKR